MLKFSIYFHIFVVHEVIWWYQHCQRLEKGEAWTFSERQHICRVRYMLLPVHLSVCPSHRWTNQNSWS